MHIYLTAMQDGKGGKKEKKRKEKGFSEVHYQITQAKSGILRSPRQPIDAISMNRMFGKMPYHRECKHGTQSGPCASVKICFLAANFVKQCISCPLLSTLMLWVFFFISIVFTQDANLVTECATAVIYLFILRLSGHLFGPEDLK